MIETLTAVCAMFAAGVGVIKGGADLYASIKELLPSSGNRILYELGKLSPGKEEKGGTQQEIEAIYFALEKSKPRVEQILKRIKFEYPISAF